MKNEAKHNTIFDDVFRTMVQKMPELLIPVINEVFCTNYTEKDYSSQLRNEQEELKVNLSDGHSFQYRTPVIKVQEYTKDDRKRDCYVSGRRYHSGNCL